MTEGVVSVAKVVLLLLIFVPKTGKSSLKFSTHLSYFIGSKMGKLLYTVGVSARLRKHCSINVIIAKSLRFSECVKISIFNINSIVVAFIPTRLLNGEVIIESDHFLITFYHSHSN